MCSLYSADSNVRSIFAAHCPVIIFNFSAAAQNKLNLYFESCVVSTFIKLKVLWRSKLEDALLTQVDDTYKTSPAAAYLLSC